MSYSADDLVSRYDRLKGDRGTWESHWEEVAEFCAPRRLGFVGERSPGEKRMQRVLDPTGIRATELLAAGLHGMLTNPAAKWFTLRLVEDDLNEGEATQAYLHEVERRLFSAMHAPGSAITTHLHELYQDLAAFGTAVLFTGRSASGRLLFQARSLSECVIDENAEGQVDTVFRRFRQTTRQVVEAFGLDAVSAKVRERWTQGKYDDKIELLHVVCPRLDRDPVRKDGKSMPWASCYLECEGRHELREEGFQEFPYAVPRWSKAAGEVYGRSPAMTALPDVKMLQEMMKATLKAAQKKVDPPMLISDDGVVGPIRTVPGGLNFIRNNARMEPLLTGGDIGLGLEMMNQTRSNVMAAFFVDQLQFASDATMTATEVVQRTQERMRLLGPILGRMEAELLGPLITRVFGLLGRDPGMLPLPPEEIEDREFTVEYVSPLARAQRQQEADGLVQVLNIALPLAQGLPAIMQRLDADRLLPWLADRFGLDPDLLLSDEDLAQQQQATAMQQAMPALAQGAAAGKDVAAAGKLAAEAGLLGGMNGGLPQ